MANDDKLHQNSIKDLRSFIIEWNNRFPYDRIYRRKYNIPFMSETHLDVCQIDVLLDCLEDKMFKEFVNEIGDSHERDMKYKKGEIFIEKEEEPEMISQMFDDLDIDSINNKNVD